MEDVILYFVQNANNEHLGRTKLMKLLYYADFDHYERAGEPITGATYKKMPHGPMPDQGHHTLDVLIRSGKLVERSIERGPHVQISYDIIGDPPIRFTPAQLATLEAVVAEWRDAPSKTIEKASHDEPPWNGVRDREIIPYHLAYYRNRCGEMELDAEELLAMAGGAEEWG